MRGRGRRYGQGVHARKTGAVEVEQLNGVSSSLEIGHDARGLVCLEITGDREVHGGGHYDTVDYYAFWPVQNPGEEARGEGITDSQRVRAARRHDHVVERGGTAVGVSHIHHLMLRIDRIGGVD